MLLLNFESFGKPGKKTRLILRIFFQMNYKKLLIKIRKMIEELTSTCAQNDLVFGHELDRDSSFGQAFISQERWVSQNDVKCGSKLPWDG